MLTWMIWVAVLPPLISGFIEDSCNYATCNARCGSSTPADFGKCFCDEMCLTFGDCCSDYMTECTTEQFLDMDETMAYMRNRSMVPYLECIETVDFATKLKQVYTMVTECPDMPNPLCSDRGDSVRDLDQVVPVYDEGTELIYFNHYCARCHGIVDFQAPKPHFICANTSEAAAMGQKFGMRAFGEYLVGNCQMQLDFRETSLQKPPAEYPCSWRLEQMVQDCEDSSDANQTLYCQSFKAVVYVPGEYDLYRNQHCVACNGLPSLDLDCVLSQPDRPSLDNKGDGLPSFGLLMDFSSDTGFSDQITFSNKTVCPSNQYLDVLNNVCISRACDSTEVLVEDQCHSLEFDLSHHVNVVPPMEELHLLLRLDMYDAQIEDFTNGLSDYEEQADVRVTEVNFIDCVSGVMSSFLEYPFNASSDLCVDIVLTSNRHSFPWNDIMSFDIWYDVAWNFRGLMNLFVTTHTNIPPACRIGNLKWHTNFTLVTPDLVGLGASYSVLFPELGRTYPIEATAFLLEINFESTDDPQVQFGVCELAILTCDKITVESADYNITGGNETHVQLIVRSVDGQEWEIEASRADFAITTQGLVICADLLIYENITVSNQSISNANDGNVIEGYLTTIGLSLSIVCLIITFSVHCIFPSLQRTMAGRLLMNLCMSLLFAQLLFLLSGVWADDFVACKALAVCQHYAWLVSFCWMNVFAVDVSITFVNMKRGIAKSSLSGGSKRFAGYSCYAWGLPALYCIIGIGVDQLTDLAFTYGWDSVPTNACWIRPNSAVLYSFALPIGIILFINTVCFVLTLIVFIQTRHEAQKATSSDSNADTLLIAVKLSTVMGFTWIFGFLGNVQSLSFFVYLFILFNTLQGVFLFVSFICTKRMFRLMKHFVKTGERVMLSSTHSYKSQRATGTYADTNGSEKNGSEQQVTTSM